MNFHKFAFLIIALIFYTSLYSQEYYDIKNPGNLYYKKCSDCLNLINNKPKEIQFGIQRDYDNNLYFIVTHKDWFEDFFKKSSDGIAIDIVNKNKYSCQTDKSNSKSIIRGELQKPIYLKELKQNMLPSQHGEVVIYLGKVPQEFLDEQIEFNIIFLKNKYLCYYNNFFDLKTYRWDLLEMGFYMDSLTYKSKYDKSISEQENYILSNKVLRFEIPFEKNKSDYSKTDIQPLYDSLQLTDYNIRNITIRAFSSVEGDQDRNLELQDERANSIVNALQAYQDPTITYKITSSENWVEFLNDISLTNFSSLAEMSKEQIKQELKDKQKLELLEPYLNKHRKAIVILDLEKKNKYSEMSPDGLLSLFNTSIANKNLKEAMEIQNSIFDRIRNQELPANFINKLEIPEKSEFGLLVNKSTVFKYLMNQAAVYETYLELQKLEDYLPNDGHIKYNIVATKFKVWLLGEQAVDPENFEKEINDLKKYGISNSLVKRMLINYNIIMCEYYMMQGDFYNKDKSLKYIYTNYKYLSLSDQDYLSLAQYFSSYAKYDWAIKILNSKVREIDIDEDLIFYYLNLTLIDEKLTKRSDYRTVMLNAININKQRYCKIFDPFGEGGVTFQLLENDYLRKTYCENCQ